ncbi:PilZ domain-containing protein [Chitinibacter bivalviorum]|uniref:PilZ domain-containing protein n=1 Tax=Chitinibacter bivalviorum TaxID=2739434 RepID=A0A7H9BGS6_9NEIS|nr:PilZ domain-containing protein [Chitinibacter bivalviorum]QLG87795.1 PilZ domain-containing protein [Chitinibacter bivalviorum]
MLNPLKLFRFNTASPSMELEHEPIDQLPSPDIVRNPQQIIRLLQDMSSPSERIHALALFEGSRSAIGIWDMQLQVDRHQCDFEVIPQRGQLIGKHLTVIANWHEYRMAFSSPIVSQYNQHHFAFDIPSEVIQLSGRNFYRVHPAHKTLATLLNANIQLKGELHDLSEGGIGIKLDALQLAQLSANASNKLIIEITGQRIGITHFSICNIQTPHQERLSRVGLVFDEMAAAEQFKLRRLLLQLQTRH